AVGEGGFRDEIGDEARQRDAQCHKVVHLEHMCAQALVDVGIGADADIRRSGLKISDVRHGFLYQSSDFVEITVSDHRPKERSLPVRRCGASASYVRIW